MFSVGLGLRLYAGFGGRRGCFKVSSSFRLLLGAIDGSLLFKAVQGLLGFQAL